MAVVLDHILFDGNSYFYYNKKFNLKQNKCFIQIGIKTIDAFVCSFSVKAM